MAACGLVVLAGCGGDSTETVTVTDPGGQTTTDTGAATTTTETDVVEDCNSRAAPNISRLSARNMSCEQADALVADVVNSLSREPFSAAGFDCEILGSFGPESGPILGAEDIRCTSGEMAFRFSFGD